MKINDFVNIKFSTINKLETLEEYKEECCKKEYETITNTYDGVERRDTIRNWEIEKCKIEQYFKLTQKEFKKITNNFLDKNILYRGKGGNTYIGENKDFKDSMIAYDEKMLEEYRANNARLVTALQNMETEEVIFIDAQGSDYARYVGIVEHDPQIILLRELRKNGEIEMKLEDNCISLDNLGIIVFDIDPFDTSRVAEKIGTFKEDSEMVLYYILEENRTVASLIKFKTDLE